jgi:hypothetical protein
MFRRGRWIITGRFGFGTGDGSVAAGDEAPDGSSEGSGGSPGGVRSAPKTVAKEKAASAVIIREIVGISKANPNIPPNRRQTEFFNRECLENPWFFTTPLPE